MLKIVGGKHRGRTIALSRRGLISSIHRKGKPIRLDLADVPLGTDLSYFVRWFRDLVREMVASDLKAGATRSSNPFEPR